MTLTLCSEFSAADWLTAGDEPDQQWAPRTTFGPAGFASYARLRFIPDPAYDGQRESDNEFDDDALSETAQLQAVLDLLAHHTRTPDECYFCLWDGWGLREPDGVPEPAVSAETSLDRTWEAGAGYRSLDALPAADPSSRRPASRLPLLTLPHRAYLLYRGSVSDLGERGSTNRWPGQPHLGHQDPAFVWPADHAWCIASDVDPHWAGIGAATAAIDQLVRESRVDVVRADPRAVQPSY